MELGGEAGFEVKDLGFISVLELVKTIDLNCDTKRNVQDHQIVNYFKKSAF